MKVNTSDHIYSQQVKSFFKNERFTAAHAIGMQNQVSQETISHKSESLRKDLAGYDLRNISSNELGKLASRLLVAGEISDNAAVEFMVIGVDQTDKDARFDAISLFESKYANIKKYAENDSTLTGARRISSDALHTLYNLDDFIRGSRESLGINTKV